MRVNGRSQFQKRLTVPWEMSKAQGILSRKLSVTILRGHLERVWEAVSVPVPQLILFIRQCHRLRKKPMSGFPGPTTAASPGRVLGMQDLKSGIIQRTRKLEVDHQSVLPRLLGAPSLSLWAIKELQAGELDLGLFLGPVAPWKGPQTLGSFSWRKGGFRVNARLYETQTAYCMSTWLAKYIEYSF